MGKNGEQLEMFLVELMNQAVQPSTIGTQSCSLLAKLVERRPALTMLPDPAVRAAERT